MRVVVTGAGGMLGQEIVRTFAEAGHEVIQTDRVELDITNRQAVFSFIARTSPGLVVNTAAYNLVDRVEDPAFFDLAFAVNAKGPTYLAEACKTYGARFVHYSTDYVFEGTRPEGYREYDLPRPISKYGETKLAGEVGVQMANMDALIIRLSKLFGAPGKTDGAKISFVAMMLKLASEKPSLSIVNEEVGCPTYAPDLADATRSLIDAQARGGVYHLVNSGKPVTWYEFAEEIFTIANVSTPRIPVPSSAFPRPAKCPKFAPLLNTKGPILRDRTEALKAFFSKMQTV